MEEQVNRHAVCVRRIVLAAMILIAILAAGSVVYAAPQLTAGRPSIRQATVFDPFLYRAIALSKASVTAKPASPPGAPVSSLRRSIRAPSRPPCRSAFRPGYDWGLDAKRGSLRG